MASTEHSDHQTMLLVVPKPATPLPPSPSLHVYFLLSGEQPTSPLPANRSCPQPSGSKSPPLRSPPRLLSHLCPGEHLQGGDATTEDRPLFTHSRASGHGLFKDTGYFSFIFPPQSSAEDSLQIHESVNQRKGKRGKPRVRSADNSSSAASFSFHQTQMESQRQNSELCLDRALWHPQEGLSCDCGVIKIQGNNAVPSRRRSG